MSTAWRLLVGALRARRGRALALLLLIAAGVALYHAEATPLRSLRHLLFDQYQQRFPRTATYQPAVIVEIDEQSLRDYGQWPWPRSLVADLVTRILAAKPVALGFDILFVEPDRYSPPVLGRYLPQLPGTTWNALPEPDQLLAAALAKGPTVLALSGEYATALGVRNAVRGVPLASRGGDPLEHLLQFPSVLASLPALRATAAGEGIINGHLERDRYARERGVMRQLPLAARIGDAVVPSLGLEMLRLAQSAEHLAMVVGPDGLERIGSGDYTVPVLPNGEVVLHFEPWQGSRYVSASQVLKGQVPAERLAERFVLVGLTGLGLQDQVVTPLGERIPGIDIHAQVIDSLLTGDVARRPDWMRLVEIAALLAGGLFLIVAVPRLPPVVAAGLGGGLAVLLFGAGFAAFFLGHWLFDASSVFALLNPIFITLLGNTLVEADQKRKAAERDLQDSREAAARVAGELDAARRIQMGMLPDPGTAFPGEQRFDIAALLEPARAVGGDYYDCFAIDDQRICFAIGDVSGKGVPASLFMTVTKTLAGALVRRTNDLGTAMRELEGELNRNNAEFLFVTAFVAVLDVESGRLTCACAGHDMPVLLRGSTVSRLDVTAEAGPPLCALGDFPFVASEVRLQPGDALCLFTDGVTEATNGQGYFGAERLLQALGRPPTTATARTLVAAVRDSVRAFEADHPPADDLTLLVIRWQPGISAR